MITLTHHGIDLTAPGGLAALFATNRARYGDLQMMAEPTDPPEGGGDQQQGQGDTGKPGKPADDAPKFTQADVDRMIADRARRIAKSEYGDYDEVKKKAEQFDAAEASKQSDLDKAVTKARTEGETAATQRLTTERVLDKAEIAAAGKFADTTDARLRLTERARGGEFTDKSGAIDTDAIKAAVEAELKAAPHLAAGTGKGRAAVDHGQGGGTGQAPKRQAGEEEARRRWPELFKNK